jgi:alkylated DNA repair protein (DNA oxidative demethylase)
MPGGTEFKLKATNAGAFAWRADGERFSYATRQASGRPWPAIPRQILEAAARANAVTLGGVFVPNNCLINYYDADGGRLGLHRDDTPGEDARSPIVTFSLGDSAVFGVGGASAREHVFDFELQSGDVLVMGGPARLFYHRVAYVRPHTSDLLARGGRISVTLRRVWKWHHL